LRVLLRDLAEVLEGGVEVKVVEAVEALADERVKVERVGVGVLGLRLRWEAKD
jgi:hypothetical protein